MTDIPRKDWASWNWDVVEEEVDLPTPEAVSSDRRIAGLLARMAERDFSREETLSIIRTALEETLETGRAPRLCEAGFIARALEAQ